MGKELVRVESAISALSSGNLAWEKWPIDAVIAHGLAGRRNPLGAALDEFLDSTEPTAGQIWGVVLLLATQLMKFRKLEQSVAREIAWRGFEWWKDSRCTTCGGRGHVDKVQRTCPDCRGSGARKMPNDPPLVRDAISLLIEAQNWMEGQLAALQRDASRTVVGDGHVVHLPMKDSQADHGFNHSPVTPARSSVGTGRG